MAITARLAAIVTETEGRLAVVAASARPGDPSVAVLQQVGADPPLMRERRHPTTVRLIPFVYPGNIAIQKARNLRGVFESISERLFGLQDVLFDKEELEATAADVGRQMDAMVGSGAAGRGPLVVLSDGGWE